MVVMVDYERTRSPDNKEGREVLGEMEVKCQGVKKWVREKENDNGIEDVSGRGRRESFFFFFPFDWNARIQRGRDAEEKGR